MKITLNLRGVWHAIPISWHKDVDDCIREFQLSTYKYKDAIEWILFDKLVDVKKIGKGEFGSVYFATVTI